MPSFVVPNAAKVDLPSLRADLAKYASSGLTADTMEWWTKFIDTLGSNMALQEEPPSTWILTELLELKNSANQPPLAEDVPLPQQLLHMCNTEDDDIPEVYLCVP